MPPAAQPPPSLPPSFDLPKPDYPTAPSKAQPALPAHQLGAPSAYPPRLAAANGLGAKEAREGEQSELFMLDEEAAYPTYHPGIVIDGWRDERWLTAQFDIAPNGRFRVALLEGTGDPALDALALSILRQWTWSPKKVRRRPVASTEILRLKRNVTQAR
jgi:hypothetical protein